tara:strand:- start:199 stop:1338 length:1140 start_codon:yes stop_codon:yes gene_type:complete
MSRFESCKKKIEEHLGYNLNQRQTNKKAILENQKRKTTVVLICRKEIKHQVPGNSGCPFVFDSDQKTSLLRFKNGYVGLGYGSEDSILFFTRKELFKILDDLPSVRGEGKKYFIRIEKRRGEFFIDTRSPDIKNLLPVPSSAYRLFTKKPNNKNRRTRIPELIKEDILAAIKEIDKTSIPQDRHSLGYSLLYKNQCYPPKYLIGRANKIRYGKELDPNSFSGGEAHANKFIKELGFEIVDGGTREYLSLEGLNKLRERKQKKLAKLKYDDIKKKSKLASGKPPKKKVESTQFLRDESVVLYVKWAAKGICDLCEEKAPFKNKDGKPYLECHHVKQLSKGGEDSNSNAVALCPNCHRKMHSLNLNSDLRKLRKRILERDS